MGLVLVSTGEKVLPKQNSHEITPREFQFRPSSSTPRRQCHPPSSHRKRCSRSDPSADARMHSRAGLPKRRAAPPPPLQPASIATNPLVSSRVSERTICLCSHFRRMPSLCWTGDRTGAERTRSHPRALRRRARLRSRLRNRTRLTSAPHLQVWPSHVR